MKEKFHDSIFWIETEKIQPNQYQPRKDFDESTLQDLADSIRQYGVLQPLVVTRHEEMTQEGGMQVRYELIAGERRLRASKIAGVRQVPVVIRTGEETARERLELAIIENVQREDLNPIDRARAFIQLADEFKLTHAQIGKKLGKSREYVSNSIRLLQLPQDIMDAVRSGKITEGHTRPLMMLRDRPEEQHTMFKEMLYRKMSVREAERIARSIAKDKVRKPDKNFDPRIQDFEKKFSERLGTRVSIEKKQVGGKIVIDYFSPADLSAILELMKADGIKHSNHEMMDRFIEQQKDKADSNPRSKANQSIGDASQSISVSMPRVSVVEKVVSTIKARPDSDVSAPNQKQSSDKVAIPTPPQDAPRTTPSDVVSEPKTDDSNGAPETLSTTELSVPPKPPVTDTSPSESTGPSLSEPLAFQPDLVVPAPPVPVPRPEVAAAAPVSIPTVTSTPTASLTPNEARETFVPVPPVLENQSSLAAKPETAKEENKEAQRSSYVPAPIPATLPRSLQVKAEPTVGISQDKPVLPPDTPVSAGVSKASLSFAAIPTPPKPPVSLSESETPSLSNTLASASEKPIGPTASLQTTPPVSPVSPSFSPISPAANSTDADMVKEIVGVENDDDGVDFVTDSIDDQVSEDEKDNIAPPTESPETPGYDFSAALNQGSQLATSPSVTDVPLPTKTHKVPDTQQFSDANSMFNLDHVTEDLDEEIENEVPTPIVDIAADVYSGSQFSTDLVNESHGSHRHLDNYGSNNQFQLNQNSPINNSLTNQKDDSSLDFKEIPVPPKPSTVTSQSNQPIMFDDFSI